MDIIYVMDESVYIKATAGQTGTSPHNDLPLPVGASNGQVSHVIHHVILQRNDIIELLKTLEGLKSQLQPLLK